MTQNGRYEDPNGVVTITTPNGETETIPFHHWQAFLSILYMLPALQAVYNGIEFPF